MTGHVRRARAFTLLELLVSMGILSALGMSLIFILRGGLATWTYGEARRESSQVAQVVFESLREDLQSATIFRQRLGKTGPVEARLICDYDRVLRGDEEQPIASDRQRLTLVRSLKAESENPVTGLAGTVQNARGVLDMHRDREEALASDLRATGGVMEVAYALGAEEPDVLYRLVRAPIGGANSLFNLDRLPSQRRDPRRDAVLARFAPNLKELDGVSGVMRRGALLVVLLDGSFERDTVFEELEASVWNEDLQLALEAEEMDLSATAAGDRYSGARREIDARLGTWGKPIARRVLFLGFEFWHQYTRSWHVVPGRFRGRREHGALDYWDSTRGLLKVDDPMDFSLFKSERSAQDASDDILPERVRVTLVVSEPARTGTETELLVDLESDSAELKILNPGRAPAAPSYVLIDDEWILYSEVEGSLLIVGEFGLGRGARGTTPARHLSGTPAVFGRSFQTIVTLPARVGDWSE